MSRLAEGNRLYYEERDIMAAFECYRAVPASDPGYATAQRIIGHNILGREWGRWTEGIAYLDSALQAAPGDAKVLEDAGRAYVAVGRLEEGRQLLSRAGTAVAARALRDLDRHGTAGS